MNYRSSAHGESPLPSTELENPLSQGFDSKTAREIVGIIHSEDRKAWEALDSELETIAAVVDAVAGAFERGRRLIYLGAGTSGRLGVLDASECPPTFGVDPGLVEGFIAGGDGALREAVEGAEDSVEGGARLVSDALVCEGDVVCGISASGRTPFVAGALEEARGRGAVTVLIAADGGLRETAEPSPWDHLVILDVGPECVAGSTRMKAGTATKMALNMITTGAMVRWGKVYDNLMVDLVASNTKLIDRARRIVEQLGEVNSREALELLELAEGGVKLAVVMARKGVGPDRARALLGIHKGHLRPALEENLDSGSS